METRENNKWTLYGRSIPISTIPTDQMAEAIASWSEGNPHLERLLWACFNNGITTAGSCAHCPYLELDIGTCDSDAVNRLLLAAERFGKFEIILFLSPGNPYSGPNWYEPRLTFAFPRESSRLSKDRFLDVLSNALEKDDVPSNGNISNIYTWYEFLKDKESELTVRFTSDGLHYTLELSFWKNIRNLSFYLPLLMSVGFTLPLGNHNNSPEMHLGWTTTSSAEFKIGMKGALNYLKKNWTLKPRTEITDDIEDAFNIKAFVMRKKFGTDTDGVKRHIAWLNKEAIIHGHPPVSY